MTSQDCDWFRNAFLGHIVAFNLLGKAKSHRCHHGCRSFSLKKLLTITVGGGSLPLTVVVQKMSLIAHISPERDPPWTANSYYLIKAFLGIL